MQIDLRERESKVSICCSTYLCLLVSGACALEGDGTDNLGAPARCPNQMSCSAWAEIFVLCSRFVEQKSFISWKHPFFFKFHKQIFKKTKPALWVFIAGLITWHLHYIYWLWWDAEQHCYVRVFPCEGETDDSQLTHLETKTYSSTITSWVITQLITDRKANLLSEGIIVYIFRRVNIGHN